MAIIDVGWYYGMIAGVGGLAGTFIGGWYADRLANKRDDQTWYVWVPFISTLAAIPFALITFLIMPDGYSAAFSYLIPVFFGGLYLAPCIAATHFLVGVRMRAMASAILLFVLNLIGLGLGPMMTGLVSDWLTPEYGVDALRYAMALTVLVNLWCAAHYYLSTKTIRADIALAAE
jgi:MFS family permease